MRRHWKHLFIQQHGSSIILVSLTLVVLLVMAGLVVDMGTVYNTKSHLQKTANAAVLSGAQELTHTEAEVSAVVNEVLQYHGEAQSLHELGIEPGRKVSVTLKTMAPLVFSGLFGYDTADVGVHAAAEIQTMVEAMGAAPLGIDESISLVFNQEYKLKVDQTEVDTGNFGVLALGGTGANTYEQNLKYGYSESIKIGNILDTQTGNISGKTRSGIKERLEQCPYLAGETHHRDCSRVILIPVYRPYSYDTNQLKQVEITGFAYFYITEPMSSNDTSITGMFVKRAGTGFVDQDAVNYGAYGIKLTE
jgi:hypothetical protein